MSRRLPRREARRLGNGTPIRGEVISATTNRPAPRDDDDNNLRIVLAIIGMLMFAASILIFFKVVVIDRFEKPHQEVRTTSLSIDNPADPIRGAELDKVLAFYGDDVEVTDEGARIVENYGVRITDHAKWVWISSGLFVFVLLMYIAFRHPRHITNNHRLVTFAGAAIGIGVTTWIYHLRQQADTGEGIDGSQFIAAVVIAVATAVIAVLYVRSDQARMQDDGAFVVLMVAGCFVAYVAQDHYSNYASFEAGRTATSASLLYWLMYVAATVGLAIVIPVSWRVFQSRK